MIYQSHPNKAQSNRLRSGVKMWNWSRSSIGRIWPLSGHGRPNRHLSLSGGVKIVAHIRVYHFGHSRSDSGISEKMKLYLFNKFMETM